MSSNPTSFRFPPNIEGKADPQVVQTIQDHDDAINDLQQAIPELKSQITALQKTGASSTTTNTSSASSASGVTPAQASAIATQAIQSTLGVTNNQTGTSYTPLNSDYGSIITLNNASPVAVPLDANGAGIGAQWWAFIQNNGTGTATLTPASGTINGAADITLVTGQSAAVFFDGTNWWAATSTASGGSGYSLGSAVTTANVALGAAAGSGAVVNSVSGLDGSHTVEFTTGTSPTITGVLFTFTFTAHRGNNTYPVYSMAQSFAFSSGQAPYVAGGSNASYTLNASGVALQASTSYIFNVSCP